MKSKDLNQLTDFLKACYNYFEAIAKDSGDAFPSWITISVIFQNTLFAVKHERNIEKVIKTKAYLLYLLWKTHENDHVAKHAKECMAIANMMCITDDIDEIYS